MTAFDAERLEPDDVFYFRRRCPGRTYISKQFKYRRPNSKDFEQPARIIWQVFDCVENGVSSNSDITTNHLSISNRVQIKITVARETSHYKELAIQKINTSNPQKLTNILSLKGEQVNEFIALLQTADTLSPIENMPGSINIASLYEIINDSETMQMAYSRYPELFRTLIESDIKGEDVVAIKKRKNAVHQFETMLANSSLQETDWQKFFENNPWILGAGLGVQLFTSWDSTKLEKVVQGNSVAGEGKRVDALYTTSGVIKSFVFAEIKKPNTSLLSNMYRPGCWTPSKELAGGISQVHATIQEAEDNISNHFLMHETEEGYSIPGSEVYLFRPKAYLVIGNTEEFVDPETHGKNNKKIRSFELFRSSIITPEIVTYDELLAKARWLVDVEDNRKSREATDAM